VPLSYRGAPLDGADHALVGTMEHGVLGQRWAYDGCHDPVLVDQLLALIEGRAQAQDQSTSDAPDREVTSAYTGEGSLSAAARTATATDDQDGTELRTSDGTFVLRLHRVLHPAAEAPQDADGHITGAWQLPDGTRARAVFAALHTTPRDLA
jgi:hypothetical protein